MTRGERLHRLAEGRLFEMHRGVYAVGHQAVGFLGRVMAALCAMGPAAVASHVTAAALWALLAAPEVIEVTVPLGRRRSRAGVRVHYAPVPIADRLLRHGLPVTTPLRTLLDLAAVLPPAQLERACIEAVVQRLTTPALLVAAAEAAKGRRGIVALRRIAGAGVEPTRSETERALLRALAAAGLPRPQVNERLGRWRPDLMWPRERLSVEADAFSTHGHRSAFERDRRKDADLVAAGWIVLRFSRRRIIEEPAVVAARIGEVLTLRAA